MNLLQSHPELLALLIFLARIADVSLGTVRTILIVRGHRWIAATIGFVEVLIWVAAAGSVIQNLDRWYLAVAYAGGFSVGNVVGSWLEERLAIGTELVRAISRDRATDLAAQLNEHGYSLTRVPASGDQSVPVEVLYLIESRRRVPRLLRRIFEADPDAVCTISDVKRHLDRGRLPLRRALRIGWRSRGKRK